MKATTIKRSEELLKESYERSMAIFSEANSIIKQIKTERIKVKAECKKFDLLEKLYNQTGRAIMQGTGNLELF